MVGSILSSPTEAPPTSMHDSYPQCLPEFKLRARIQQSPAHSRPEPRKGGPKGDLTFQEVFPEISCNTSSSSLWGRLGNTVFWVGYLANPNKIRILLLMRKDFYKVSNFFFKLLLWKFTHFHRFPLTPLFPLTPPKVLDFHRILRISNRFENY